MKAFPYFVIVLVEKTPYFTLRTTFSISHAVLEVVSTETRTPLLNPHVAGVMHAPFEQP
jgi:hypothetical protein